MTATTTSSAAPPRWASTTLADHAGALTALRWLADEAPDLPSGLVYLSSYRREGQAAGEASRELQVQVRSVDEVARWANHLGVELAAGPTKHTPGRVVLSVSGVVHDIPVYVYALLSITVLADEAEALAQAVRL